jgi:hypothetical protein
MNRITNKIFIALVFCVVSYSCKTAFFYEDGYTRLDRQNTIFKKRYDKIDSIEIRNIEFCFKKKLPLNRFKKRLTTNGSIIYDTDSIVRSLNQSLANHFEYIDFRPKEHQIWSQNCDDFTKYDFRNINENFSLSTDSAYNVRISFIIESYTTKNFEIDHFLYVFDDDKHFVKYLLIFSIYEGKEIIYLDNSVHWKSIYSERNQQLNYDIPQSTIASLVNKSLEEYYELLDK